MTRLAAERQKGLSPGVSLRLVATGVGFRLMRSGVTVAVQALAVAFLVYVFAAATIDTTVQRRAAEAIAPYRKADAQLTRLRQPDTVRTITETLQHGGEERLAEYATWAGLTDTELADAKWLAQQWHDAQRWHESLPDDDRVLLFGDQPLLEATVQLDDPDERRRLEQRLAERQLEPPGGAAPWVAFFDEPLARLMTTAQRIRAGHIRALSRLDPATMQHASDEQASQTLAEAGFRITEAQLTDLRPFAERLHTAAAMTEALQDPDVRRAIARRARVTINSVTPEVARDVIATPADAAWLHERLAERNTADAPPTADALFDYADHARREQRLADALPASSSAATNEPAAMSASTESRWLGLPPRTLLLIALSCLVCVVGVANAMTMSVTERFSEIATMKCLGARSGSVMTMFLLESAALGVAGGVVGTALGLALAAAGGFVRYGTLLAMAGDALGTLGLVALGALALGVVLSVIAALLPSWFAARLPPIAAMRVE